LIQGYTPRPVADASAPSRRGFLTLASGALAALAAAITGVPVLGAVLSPWLRPRPKEGGKFIPVTTTFDLEPGVPKRVDIVSGSHDAWASAEDVTIGSVWLVKDAHGSVVAFSALCPHLGCPISLGAKSQFRCPCHDSYFHLDGAMVTGPSARPMDTLEVQVKDNVVSVRYARFKQGTKEKREI
jgi:menaquinol-cytochrome c reductase iron-sulfur subunit